MQLYYGGADHNCTISTCVGVRNIYAAVIAALAENANRTFSPEITVFSACAAAAVVARLLDACALCAGHPPSFSVACCVAYCLLFTSSAVNMYWADPNTTDTQRALLRQLVANGQLEWAGGGWVQNDEAVTRFDDQIDSHTLGRLWLQNNVGSPPIRVAWQADEFGHSATQAYLYTLMGQDALFFGRPMSRFDPLNDQTAAVWHPSASFVGANNGTVYDSQSSLLLRTQGGAYASRCCAARCRCQSHLLRVSVCCRLLAAVSAVPRQPGRWQRHGGRPHPARVPAVVPPAADARDAECRNLLR